MKSFFFSILILINSSALIAQENYADSLQRQLTHDINDSTRVALLSDLSIYYATRQPAKAMMYAEQALRLSQKNNYKRGEFKAVLDIAFTFNRQGDFPQAYKNALNALRIAESLKNGEQELCGAYNVIGSLNFDMGNYSEALSNYRRSIYYEKRVKGGLREPSMNYTLLAGTLNETNQPDSALIYAKMGFEELLQSSNRFHISLPMATLAAVYDKLNKNDSAAKFYRMTIENAEQNNITAVQAIGYSGFSNFFKKLGQADSCIFYAQKALQISQMYGYMQGVSSGSTLLMQAYESKQIKDSIFKYMKISSATKDSIYSKTRVQQFQLLAFNEQKRQEDLEAAETRFRNRLWMYALIAGLCVFLLIAIILFRNNKQKQKANKLLQRQKEKVESTLSELKSAQAQLIQSEKMASLGELTAGIAHEIQNPLNFVNNFSDVNKELLEEMKEEMDKGNLDDAKVLANDIIANEAKINLHGKRADNIVKGMLQHSRHTDGKKDLTSINKLADEYLRLAYHGLRAKDKSFNATLDTNYDDSIGNISIVPQDIGRVLLNLYNNAFYAVNEKKKQQGDNYEPTVSVVTKKNNDKIEIHVIDNGNGIPQKIVDKIFQPFFTTKSTGQGTGLGLSLAYDIVKAHGGELKIVTKEGEGAEFIVYLDAKSIGL